MRLKETILIISSFLLLCACSQEDAPKAPEANTEETNGEDKPEESEEVYFHTISIENPQDLFAGVDSKILSEYASGKKSAFLSMDSSYRFSRRYEESKWEGYNRNDIIGDYQICNAYIHGGKFYIPVEYNTFTDGWCLTCLWSAFKKVTGKNWAAYVARTLRPEVASSNPLFFEEDGSLIQTLDSGSLAYSEPVSDYGEGYCFNHTFYRVSEEKVEIEDDIIIGISQADLLDNILEKCREVFGDYVDLDSIYYPDKHEFRYIDLRDGYKFTNTKE